METTGSPTYDYLFYIFITAFAIQAFYLLFFYLLVSFFRPHVVKTQLPPVSVIVCARSEAHHLIELIPALFSQDYPEYEVIIVNDRSWDDTKDILEAFKHKYAGLHVIHIEEGEHQRFYGKKMGITLAVKGARYNHFVFTDADCRPAGKNWLKYIATCFDEKKSLVLGYSPYERKKGILNKIIRFDALNTALQYLSYAMAGLPYMGVGRNMAYTRDLFFSNKGFKSHYHIHSGDDDLFVNENAGRNNTVVQVDVHSHVTTLPKTTWESWFIQKKRHYTTSHKYRWLHKFMLGLYPLSLLILLTTFTILAVVHNHILIILTLMGFRTVLYLGILAGASRKLGQKDLVIWGWLLEPLVFLINLGIMISNRIVPPQKWS